MHRTQHESDVNCFKTLRKEFDTLEKCQYLEYINNIVSDVKHDPKIFFDYVNSKRKTSRLPCLMRYNGLQASNTKDVCDLFASFFESVYCGRQFNYDALNNASPVKDFYILSFEISDLDIISALANFKIGCGSDGITSIFLKKFASELAKPLTMLFNRSLGTGIFPNKWKFSNVIPIFKSGNRFEIENYRGISVLSSIPKLFESIVCDQLAFQIKSKTSFSQHGFVKGY